MPTYRSGTVVELLEERPGLQRVLVDLGDGAPPARAYVTTTLVPPVAAGERVVCNTTAVDLGLGTGGWHVVHWSLDRDGWSAPGTGHIMKLRYTSLQVDAGSAEEHHPELPDSLEGTPVAVCTVHSQVAAVAAAFRSQRPTARLVYVMTDGAALPLALSDLVVALRTRGLLDATVTAGHAFGGDEEAVSIASALLVARHLLAADAIVVGMGPGVVGTGTAFGTTAMEAAGVIGAAAGLGGRAALAVRASSGERRARHGGISHHVGSVLACCFAPVELPVVDELPADEVTALGEGLRPGQVLVRTATAPIAAQLAEHGLRVTTMGRPVEDDLLFFQSAAAVGTHLAAQVADG